MGGMEKGRLAIRTLSGNSFGNVLRGFLVYSYKHTNKFIYPHNLYNSRTNQLEDMQNVREMMINYDGWSNK